MSLIYMKCSWNVRRRQIFLKISHRSSIEINYFKSGCDVFHWKNHDNNAQSRFESQCMVFYLTWRCRLNLYLLVRIVFNKKNIKGKFQIMNISKTYIYACAIETFPSTFQFRHIKRRHLFKLLSINKIPLHFCCGFFWM